MGGDGMETLGMIGVDKVKIERHKQYLREKEIKKDEQVRFIPRL